MSQKLTISGMSCDGCEERVVEALETVSGVTSVEVERTNESATVNGSADAGELVAAVENAGYEATVSET